MGPLAQAAQAELQRQLMQREATARVMPPHALVPGQQAPSAIALSPEMLSLIGTAADAASTYRAMKGGRVEDNPHVRAQTPLRTVLNVVSGSLQDAAMRGVMRKFTPARGIGGVVRKVLDLYATTHGAQGIGLAGNNVQAPPVSALTRYQEQTRDAVRRQEY
jgi:hypothetical protein